MNSGWEFLSFSYQIFRILFPNKQFKKSKFCLYEIDILRLIFSSFRLKDLVNQRVVNQMLVVHQVLLHRHLYQVQQLIQIQRQ